ncbi:unnamed protein product [Diatraea saccharalis]|uniref:Cysteine dioxygenase n=1 Tax=Diatraea saccharalis TaxID=40085 RepID=A0A9P0CAN9_9NEOP|nr:unnamed protein product [Diatraea saccharalis]
MDVENANCKVRVSQCTDMEVIPIKRPLKITHEITGLEKLVEELHKVFSNERVNVQEVQSLMAGYKSDPKDWKKYAKFDRFRYTRNLVDSGNGAFNIMVLCWGPGHASAIHDHADSHCFMKLLHGSLEEVRYDWPSTVEPEVRRVQKNNNVQPCCCSGSDKEIVDKMADLDMSCQNDRCPNFGRKIDEYRNGENDKCNEEDGLDFEQMEEIGRTKLEVNDVCYINDALGLHRMENPSHVDSAVSLHLYCPPFDSCRVFDARTGKPTQVKVTFWSVNGKKVKKVIAANEIVDSQ